MSFNDLLKSMVFGVIPNEHEPIFQHTVNPNEVNEANYYRVAIIYFYYYESPPRHYFACHTSRREFKAEIDRLLRNTPNLTTNLNQIKIKTAS